MILRNFENFFFFFWRELKLNFCISLYKAFLFWIDDSRLHEPDVFLPAFPAAYYPVKLAEILNGSEVIILFKFLVFFS